MTSPTIRLYTSDDFAGVDALWMAVFPNDPERNRARISIPKKLAQQPELFFVAEDGGRIVGTTMAGYDGHRGWLYSVAVAPSHRRQGVGERLVRTAQDALRDMGCIKVNLQIRTGNEAVAGFYRALGFATDEVISMGQLL